MNTSESLKAFTDRFVLATARERFLHEAKNKPQRLLERICHSAHELLDKSLTGNRFKPKEANEYLMLSGKKGFIVITGQQAFNLMGSGEGVLIISVDGEDFYAETEATKGTPSMQYSGR